METVKTIFDVVAIVFVAAVVVCLAIIGYYEAKSGRFPD